MLPWTLLGSATVPGDGGEMRLYRRGSEYSIRVGTYELMNSRVHGSEDALAWLVCARLGKRPKLTMLIGGLGMGFTLAGVLEGCEADSKVVVAELVPEVVTWNQGPLGAVSGNPLDDRRVTIKEADVAAVMKRAREKYDAILLDVDNGPAGLTSKANDWLYSAAGLRAAFAALRPNGILAVWSAGPDAAFTRRLQQAGFLSEEVPVRGRAANKGSRFLIWIARRPGRPARPAARA
jgi:spermidine synthase